MKGSRKGSAVLKSWVNFVKKIQKEENISYREAMMEAKKRKSEWQHGGNADEESYSGSASASSDSVEDESPVSFSESSSSYTGGRSKKRRGGRRTHRKMKGGRKTRTRRH